MQNSWLFFLQGIPEMAGSFALCLALTRVPLRWGIIVAMGVILSGVIFAIRSLPFSFGLHSVVGIILMAIFITKATRVTPTKSFMAVFASLLTVSLLEFGLHKIFLVMLPVNLHSLDNNPIWYLMGLPQALLMLALAVLISRIMKPLQGVWRI